MAPEIETLFSVEHLFQEAGAVSEPMGFSAPVRRMQPLADNDFLANGSIRSTLKAMHILAIPTNVPHGHVERQYSAAAYTERPFEVPTCLTIQERDKLVDRDGN